MRVHVLQHVPFEGLGSIAGWLASRNARVTTTRFFADPALPRPEDVDWLIAMGGPMSVRDEEAHPWLADEKRFVAECVRASRRVLGICLGAQLLASALGAEVSPNEEREIGWHAIEPVGGADGSRFAAPLGTPLEAFHWHGETFALPPGAAWLARSAACPHQAFALGERVLGLQFHLEMTPDGARALIAHCPQDLAPGAHVQDAGEMLRDPERFRRSHAVMAALLDRLDAVPR